MGNTTFSLVACAVLIFTNVAHAQRLIDEGRIPLKYFRATPGKLTLPNGRLTRIYRAEGEIVWIELPAKTLSASDLVAVATELKMPSSRGRYWRSANPYLASVFPPIGETRAVPIPGAPIAEMHSRYIIFGSDGSVSSTPWTSETLSSVIGYRQVRAGWCAVVKESVDARHVLILYQRFDTEFERSSGTYFALVTTADVFWKRAFGLIRANREMKGLGFGGPGTFGTSAILIPYEDAMRRLIRRTEYRGLLEQRLVFGAMAAIDNTNVAIETITDGMEGIPSESLERLLKNVRKLDDDIRARRFTLAGEIGATTSLSFLASQMPRSQGELRRICAEAMRTIASRFGVDELPPAVDASNNAWRKWSLSVKRTILASRRRRD